MTDNFYNTSFDHLSHDIVDQLGFVLSDHASTSKSGDAAKLKCPPIKIVDFEKAGKIILDLSQKDKSHWPTTMAEFKQLFGDAIEVPSRFKKLKVVQGTDDTFVFRLPPKNQAKESMANLARESRNDPEAYGVPSFYSQLDNGGETFDNQTFHRSRVADYTLRACR